MIKAASLTAAEVEQAKERALREGKTPGERAFLLAKFIGEANLQKTPQWDFYLKTKDLPDYATAEDSVLRSFEQFYELQNADSPGSATLEQGSLEASLAEAMFALRRTETKAGRTEIIRGYWQTIGLAAKAGMVDALLELFRLVDPGHPHHKIRGHRDNQLEHTHTLLANWLTGFLWLMPSKLASIELAKARECKWKAADQNNFVKTQKRWRLYSSKRKLIVEVKEDGSFKFTK